MSPPIPKPPAADEIEEDPAITEDLNALPGDKVAIELPVEPGDPDAQPY